MRACLIEVVSFYFLIPYQALHQQTFKHLQDYYNHREHKYNKGVIHNSFNFGDLILYEKKCNVNTKPRGKGNFSLN